MPSTHILRIAVIGGGPAGLMAAQAAAERGAQVDLFDAMPSVGRKFLLAGRGGMNITHAEGYQAFVGRYGKAAGRLRPVLDQFGPQQVRDWVHGLGIDTFVGSSNRVFPTDMKAAPLLRAWLHRLREAGVQFHMRHRWLGWHDGQLCFATPDGQQLRQFDAVILALGGASWARLGSDGAWVPVLQQQGVAVAPLVPANCGFDVAWSDHLRSRYAGEPLTTVAITAFDADGLKIRRQGQFVVTEGGVEGSLIYALSGPLREQIARDGSTTIWLDLAPDHSHEKVFEEVTRPRGARSMSGHLQSRLGIKGVKSGLLRECLSASDFADEATLAQAIKFLPVTLQRPRPIDEAISSAGGVMFDGLDGAMLAAMPGVFVAGEMVDWEAPTGGYLLTACLAGGKAAGEQAVAWLEARQA
ncbi:TIGR03862 family flavoprotein [Janthinobacterium aquaticum]|uniref:TIGR03862 family flavoprotein n=1 Tax=Janthinobacterium sp. FT58W TaxID=2654254 RepID=UPI00126505FD|nr:TIGR03862 family flavoprotein [Janthinobacterium sp. FT58W]KAB8038602.1 TIGR03862 family flavoprotein [Janthinobacterium sp. FT58W]